MPDDDTAPTLPDIRTVSVVHDADADRLSVVHPDDLDPFHALGLLAVGLFTQLIDLADIPGLDDDLDDDL